MKLVDSIYYFYNKWFIMTITIYEAFDLNRVLHSLLSQQSSYNIQISFKIYSLIKWLDDVESFVFGRIRTVTNCESIDIDNPIHNAILSSPIEFVGTSLTISDLLNTEGDVKLNVNDVEILEKMIGKTEY